MAHISSKERELIRCIIRAFCPPKYLGHLDRMTRRAESFLEDLWAKGSDRADDLRQILTLLDVVLSFVDRNDREAVRLRLDEVEKGQGIFGLGGAQIGELARFAQRLGTIVVYSTLDDNGRPFAAADVGYEVFPDRAGIPVFAPPQEEVLPAELFVKPGDAIPSEIFDVAVIGSGSAGSVLVQRFVRAGLRVALVEAGIYLPESEAASSPAPAGRKRPRGWDELANLTAYYKHSGLQTTERPGPLSNPASSQTVSLFVFQGEGLGGSSVINNAVCFRMPQNVRDSWTHEFGIPWTGAELDAAYDRIAAELSIQSTAKAVVESRFNPTFKLLETATERLGMGQHVQPCEVNIQDCLGCGYCNLVCGYLRKRDVLQTMLADAGRSVAAGTGKLTILTGRRAAAFRMEQGKAGLSATALELRPRNEHFTGGLLRAKKFVVAAGAIGSSAVLERTKEIDEIGLPIGDRFSCNFASPVHADYEQPVRAFDGLAMSHFVEMPGETDFVVETWYNPPATQFLALPGWLHEFEENLKRYSHYACAAPLIGSSAQSWIDTRWMRHGEDIHLEFNGEDLAKLKRGLLHVCKLFFHSDPEPRHVLLGALENWKLTKHNYEQRIASISSFSEIQLTTGHPMGGNCMSSVPGTNAGPGVVDPSFRVYGTANVFCADASVFPTSTGVNPHWTVMAMADLAAIAIAKA